MVYIKSIVVLSNLKFIIIMGEFVGAKTRVGGEKGGSKGRTGGGANFAFVVGDGASVAATARRKES
jgi:hypothetical protein